MTRSLGGQFSRADAEDVLQDSIVALLEGLRSGKFDWTGNLAAYAHGIVRHKASRLRRSFWHQLLHFRSAPVGAVADLAAHPPAPHPQQPGHVDDVLGLIDRRARAVLELRLRGKRYREVAALLGVSAAHAAQIHRRAVLRIRKALAEGDGPWRG